MSNNQQTESKLSEKVQKHQKTKKKEQKQTQNQAKRTFNTNKTYLDTVIHTCVYQILQTVFKYSNFMY